MCAFSTIVTRIKKLCPSSSQITNEYEVNHYWRMVLGLWNLPSHITHFPGPNPVSMESTDFRRLKEDDFLVALKTDGVRHLLLLTLKPNSADPIAIMIDRTKKMYEIEIWANEDFFCEGSLFDGELVWENENLVFVVFDVIRAKGNLCTKLSYRERMEIIRNTILCVSKTYSDESVEQMIAEEQRFVARNNELQLRIIPKKCVPKSSLRSLWADRNQSGHRNDGIIFTLNSAPVDTGTATSTLKWKPMHSIDILIKLDDNDEWRMYANCNNSSGHIDLCTTPDHTFVLQPGLLLQAVRSRQPCIIECVICLEEGKILLTPERERTDKTTPNTIHTILATVRNAIENISNDDLVKLVNSV